MSISMSIGTPTLIPISIETKPSRKCRRGDRSTKRVRAIGSTTLNTAKASRIETREPRKNSTAQAHRKRLSHGRIFAVAPTPADRIPRVAARAIAQRQVTAAALANLAVATGRQQRIAAEQANSAGVAEQIEAALEAAAAPFKGSAAGEVRQGARVSAVARAVVAAEAAVDPVVEEAAAVAVDAAGKRSGSDECRVKIPSTPGPRPSYLIWWRKK
jgi:hypothetical protein